MIVIGHAGIVAYAPQVREPTDQLPRVSADAIEAQEERLRDRLTGLYGPQLGEQTAARLFVLLAGQPRLPDRRHLTERDALLIAYPDHLRSGDGASPLATLGAFAAERLRGAISAIHLLPIHPSSSDGGYAVTDCDAVDPRFGTWEDLYAIARDFRLMLDLVLNHVSASHPWFAAFLRDEEPYRSWFIVPPEGADLTPVRRPRATPLLTTFSTRGGDRDVWTTFSADQVDLNYRDPGVLLEAVRVLLEYVRRGAYLVRLDAVGFVWKAPGTESIHLPEAHAIVRVLRDVLDVVAPDVRLVAETNVPHDENVTYLGAGHREAQLVYNFALAPLLVHTLHTGDAAVLSRWAAELRTPLPSAMFLNLTASHDGIGVLPVFGLLSDAERSALVERVVAHGGLVSYRMLPDGSIAPYELNVAYVDALSPPEDPVELRVARLLVSQAIALALKGVPAIYLPTLLGSRSWREGVAVEGHNRAINRQKLQLGRDLDLAELDDVATERGLTHTRLLELVRARAATPAFDPRAAQRILDHGPGVFAIERVTTDGSQRVLAFHDVAGTGVEIALPPGAWRDAVGGPEQRDRVALGPYGVAWLTQA